MSPRARKETSRYESSGHQGVELDRRSRIYYFRGTVDNDDLEPVFIERSLRTKSLEEALRRARRLRANVAQGVVGRGKSVA